jgi:hypothetical protein
MKEVRFADRTIYGLPPTKCREFPKPHTLDANEKAMGDRLCQLTQQYRREPFLVALTCTVMGVHNCCA